MGLLKINLLGSSFAIKATEDDEYLDKLLNYYKQITDEIEKSDNLKDPTQVAILAGILICDELYKEKEKYFKLENQINQNESKQSQIKEISKLTDSMISQIEKVL